MGDCHFGDTCEWSLSTGEKFLSWLEHQNFGNKDDNEIILTGDITDRDTNAGSCISQVTRMADYLSNNFKHVYVLTGNHDKKLHRKTVQNSIEFLQNWPNISVIEEPVKLTTENGFKCLLLPFMEVKDMTLHEYYNNLPKSLTNEKVDIIAGHWNKY